jgi:hypothetical protein
MVNDSYNQTTANGPGGMLSTNIIASVPITNSLRLTSFNPQLAIKMPPSFVLRVVDSKFREIPVEKIIIGF